MSGSIIREDTKRPMNGYDYILSVVTENNKDEIFH